MEFSYAKGRSQNSRVADSHQLLWPQAIWHGYLPQENVINHLECHVLLNILLVYWLTQLLAVLIISSGN